MRVGIFQKGNNQMLVDLLAAKPRMHVTLETSAQGSIET